MRPGRDELERGGNHPGMGGSPGQNPPKKHHTWRAAHNAVRTRAPFRKVGGTGPAGQQLGTYGHTWEKREKRKKKSPELKKLTTKKDQGAKSR